MLLVGSLPVTLLQIHWSKRILKIGQDVGFTALSLASVYTVCWLVDVTTRCGVTCGVLQTCHRATILGRQSPGGADVDC